MTKEKETLSQIKTETLAPSPTEVTEPSTLTRVLAILLPIIIGLIGVHFIGFVLLMQSAIPMGLTFGVIYLLLAWLSHFLAKHKLGILGVLLAGLVLFSLQFTVPLTFFMGFVDYMQTSAQNQNSDTPQMARDYMNRRAPFDWTIEELQNLTIGQDRLEDIIAQKGKANEAKVLYDNHTLSYTSSSEPGYVNLYFDNNEDGEQVLSDFSASIPVEDIKTDIYNNSLWEKTAYEALVVGDWETGENGSLLTDVLREYPIPALANHSFSYGRQTMTLIYSNATASEQQLKGCILTFLSTDKGKTFHLIDKTINEKEE